MKKNILAENMRRFNTKNLNEEDFDSNNNGYPDDTEKSDPEKKGSEEITTTLSKNVPSIPQLKSIAKEEVGEFIDRLFQKYPNILNPTTPKDKRKVQDHFAEVINDQIIRRIVAHINSSQVERYRTPGEIEKSDRESAEYYSTHDKYGNTNYDSRYTK